MSVKIRKQDGTFFTLPNIKGDTGSQGPQGLKGDTGSAGADAKINGKNAIEIEAGNNITIEDTEKGIKINSTGGSGGTSDYTDLTNKPKINNVELNGNKSLNDLGIQPVGNYLTEETDPTVPSHVKNITQANITNWNNKLDSSKVKNTNSTTAGDVYDVRYINNMIGDVETILTRLTIGGGVS